MHFEEFKQGIRSLIMDNFFTEENFRKVTEGAITDQLNPDKVLENVKWDSLFDALVSTVKESPFGGMLGMVGGEAALEPLREPFATKVQGHAVLMFAEIDWENALGDKESFEEMRSKIETMLDLRVDELTPEKVKEIVDHMIRQHLGWLVVWGGAFGALIGVLSFFLV